MIYIQLLLAFMQVGLFSIGGGYAAIPLIESQVVEKYAWLSIAEFTDLITIAEMTPGPIAINSATFVGIRIAGAFGAVIATLGCIIPSIIIVSAFTLVYYKYRSALFMQKILMVIRPVVVSLILTAGLKILISVSGFGAELDYKGIALFVCSLVLMRSTKLNPVLIMLCVGIVYLVFSLL